MNIFHIFSAVCLFIGIVAIGGGEAVNVTTSLIFIALAGSFAAMGMREE